MAGNLFGEGTGGILLDDVNCNGHETTLSTCPHGGWGEHNCEHYEDVSISCVDNMEITGTSLLCKVTKVFARAHMPITWPINVASGCSGCSCTPQGNK